MILPITEQDRVERIDGGLLSSTIDDELVGISLERGTCYGMNKAATYVWNLLVVPRTVSELCDALGEAFEVAPDECRRDVLAYLEQLRSQGLLKA